MRDDGTVKVLDFGLAKAMSPQGVSATADAMGAMNSPTFTVRATEMGMILGTAAYMAPEQARGKTVDRRADVWAFGVVLYEMLTGRRAFAGEDISDVLAAVLRDPVPLDALPASTPMSIRRLLRRSLEKDRAKRLDSMGAARFEIDEALSPTEPSASARPKPNRLPWIAAAAAIVALIAAVVLLDPDGDGYVAMPIRVSAHLGADGVLETGLMPAFAVSSDGRMVTFVARYPKETTSRLYLRRMDQLSASALPGTDFGHTPFFSPDGKWVGFFAKGQLQKVSITGGAPIALGAAEFERGATWGDDDVITYAPVAAAGGRLLRVPAAGGAPTELGPFVQGHVTQRWPQALPGNRAIIYTGHSGVDSFEDACLVVQMLDGGAPRVVQCGGYGWRYAPTGHVLYVHGGTMFAAPFDLDRLSISGTGVPVIEGVMSAATSGSVQASLSSAGAGLLVYAPGESAGTAYPLDVMDRTGKVTPLPAPPMNWEAPNYSSDGQLIAMSVLPLNKQPDVWVYDIARNTSTRLTFSDGADLSPVFTPDGRRIAYGSAQGGAPNLFWKSADGSGEEQRLATSKLLQAPGAWTPDGTSLIFMQQDPKRQVDLWILPMLADGRGGLKAGTPKVLLATPAVEAFPAISPDGKWLSVHVGRIRRDACLCSAVRGLAGQVADFDRAGGVERVVAQRQGAGVWRRRRAPAVRDLRRVRRHVPRLTRAVMVAGHVYIPRALSAPFALHPDGQRVVTVSQAGQFTSAADRVVLVTNFFEEIRAKSGIRSTK